MTSFEQQQACNTLLSRTCQGVCTDKGDSPRTVLALSLGEGLATNPTPKHMAAAARQQQRRFLQSNSP
jgi:hypothetical protein